MVTDKLRIESASETDIPLVLTFIKELAAYEQLLDHVKVNEERLRQALFGNNPRAHAVIAYLDDLPVAFAIYFFTFSTFEGAPGLYIEDIFVRPTFRRYGVGRKLFGFLCQTAREQGCCRIELSVLNWNEQAIHFYKKLGGEPVSGWTVFRFSDESITNLT
ncbi:MAG TPA: GNAT family N-acetyltransferase [Pyrinomonadaceae bacterium]|nr:GNAT family N-acetyltransferase [Pyrinomonadaceae bacterium]